MDIVEDSQCPMCDGFWSETVRHCQEIRIRSSVASVKSGCMKSVTSVAL